MDPCTSSTSSSSSSSTHTRRYLQALLVPLSPPPAHRGLDVVQAEARRRSSDSDSGNGAAEEKEAAPSDAGARGGGGGATPTPSSSSSSSHNDDDDDDEAASSSGQANSSSQDKASDDAQRSVSAMDVDARIRSVLDLLDDDRIPEEDMPDKLKEVLAKAIQGTEAKDADLDAAALAILHRHREDVHPTGQIFSSPSGPAKSGGMSRSSSFRRGAQTNSAIAASTLALKRAGITTPIRPISPSPLGPQSPSLAHLQHRDPFSHIHDHGNGSVRSTASSVASNTSAPSSPFASPRTLSAAATSFRPNAAATEFRPTTPTIHTPNPGPLTGSMGPSGSLPSLSVKMPDHPFRPSRSPMGTPSIESPTLWSFQNSPLGTPKFNTSASIVAASPSLAGPPLAGGPNHGSYFPSSSGTASPLRSTTPQPPAIPSDPWNRLSDSSSTSAFSSNPGVSNSSSTASSEASYDDLAGRQGIDPFSSVPLVPNDQTSSGKDQILSSEEEDEWGMPSTSYQDTLKRLSPNSALGTSGRGPGGMPHWDLYGAGPGGIDDEQDEDELQMLQYTGGQLVKDELVIVEPPQHERPVFDEAPQPQSTSQYSQLPTNFSTSPSAPSLSLNPPGLGGPPGLTSPGLLAGPVPGNGLGQHLAGGLGEASSGYIMTPFDVLCSIFADSDIQPAELEEALSQNGWDVDRAMEWIIERGPGGQGGTLPTSGSVDRLNIHGMGINDPRYQSQPGSGAVSPARVLTPGGGPGMPMGMGGRPLVLPRDAFARQHGSHGPFLGPGGKPQSPRWQQGPGGYGSSQPGTPRGGGAGDYFGGGAGPGSSSGPGGPGTPGNMGSNPSTRLCKYYLQGNCLRSDCRFSHDLSKAVCKFWLRGHCLKGEGRCEFLHSVPPHLAQDVAQLRMNALRVREQEKARWMNRGMDDHNGGGGFDDVHATGHESVKRVDEDFPSLAAATASASRHTSASGSGNSIKDPAVNRWAGAVKNGRPTPAIPVNSRPSLPRSPSGGPGGRAGLGGLNRMAERSAPFSQPRQSARLSLRPPTLLPTVTTGAAVADLYDEYRENFFEYGEARNKCLVKAANCYQKGDGAGARKWSREAGDWNRQIAREGSLAAGRIVEERKRALREAVMHGERPGRADESSDRQYRGQLAGAGLGVCLGVAAAGEILGPEGFRLSVAERTECALDLHGLHADEAIDILEKFLLAIASEHIMRGLSYVIVGQERHTGTADPARGTRKIRLADAIGGWLDNYGYAFWLTQGIFVIDPWL